VPQGSNILTERLILRPFEASDAPRVAELCADRDIAANTLVIPHPYTLADAQSWLAAHRASFEAGTHGALAITLQDGGELVGCVGLTIERAHDRAELGYWIGRAFWNRGYATEASRAAIRHGFVSHGLERIFASHFLRNPASGRVLEKCGMRFEGIARRYVRKWGVYEDGAVYAIIRADFEAALAQAQTGQHPVSGNGPTKEPERSLPLIRGAAR
jgi:[ribosomal protein S5]-alanine N-acetyltransferase